MRNMKKAVSLLLAVSLVLTTLVGGDGAQAAKKAAAKVSSVKITNAGKTMRIQKGKTFKLKTSVKVKPNKSKYKKLKFSSSNKKVVLVNSRGLLKGVKPGTAKITAASKVNRKKKATISVTVTANKSHENDDSDKTEEPSAPGESEAPIPSAGVPTQEPGQGEVSPSPDGPGEMTAEPETEAPGEMTAEPTPKQMEEPGEVTAEPTEAPDVEPTPEPTDEPEPEETVKPTVKPGKTPKPTGFHELNNPQIDNNDVAMWDCVYFGNYWQNDTNDDGMIDENDEKQPIKWRVLSVDGDDALLLADENLGWEKYNDGARNRGVTWKTCTLRSWLNGYGIGTNREGRDYSDDNFLDHAFTSAEQSAIRMVNVVNEDNPVYITEGGSDTSDYVYLLSINEALDPAYALAHGGWTGSTEKNAKQSVMWWLRSPGDDSYMASYVGYDGGVSWRGIDATAVLAVRPALHLNLSSVSNWSYAGTVVSEVPKPTPKPTPRPIPTWTPDPDKKVENVMLTYDYEFPGHRMVRFDGTVVNHDDESDSEMYENANVTGYPAEGIDVRYYDRVIVKYEGGKLTGGDDGSPNSWYGKATLSSTDDGLGQNEYSDGLFLRYFYDVDQKEGKYQDGVYTVEYDIDEEHLNSAFYYADVGLIDCISVQFANPDNDCAGFKLKTIEFISSKNEPSVSEPPIQNPTVQPSDSPSRYGLQNPTIDDDSITTWDCVYFGNYWQNDTNGDGKADQNDEKQPIKWRVLSVDGDDAFLMADENLDCQPYNEEHIDVTWETCTLRSWLNDDFLSQAFTAGEQSAIRMTEVVNSDNPHCDVEGGNDTFDQVYLLSVDEVENLVYGFSADDYWNRSAKSRKSKNTEYAKGQGAYTATLKECPGNGFWWLRSPGGSSDSASCVSCRGYVSWWSDSEDVDDDSVAVRPVLHLNLAASSDVASTSSWSYAGTVTTGGQPTSTYIPWTPDPDKKVENVTLTYDYEFPGNRMVRFDGTVVDHEDENANVEGYPADGIDIRYYDKVIVKYEGGKPTEDEYGGGWYGKATLSSTDKGLGQDEYADGLFLKYFLDIDREGKYQNGVYIVEYNIDEKHLNDAFDFVDVGLLDCISVQLENPDDDFAGFKLKSIEFIAKKPLPATPTSTPMMTPISFAPGEIGITEHEFTNPTIDDDGMTTWDCVYFGNYWQNDTNGDGKADQSDEKQPIKWRVLSVDGDDAFLLADGNLDCQPYSDTDATWETCGVRSWLNDDFFTQAFSPEEQSAIRTTNLVNDDSPYYGTEGGGDTSDHVYLLSIDEALNPVYGFSADYSEYAKSRRSKNTEYAKGQGAYISTSASYANNGVWWLRSPGESSKYASGVNINGSVDRSGRRVNSDIVTVRPALHLKLSSATDGSYAGTAISEEVPASLGTPAPTVPGVETSKPIETPEPTIPPSKSPSQYGLENPSVSDDGITTWDCVYFGNYWQNDTNGDGKADQDDEKQPIKWRVLSVDGDDAFLLADENLDCQPYNDECIDVTWETCTMRSWLNDDFFRQAFTEEEQSAVRTTKVVNDDNPYRGTEGGEDTFDQVYLLSINEVRNPAYGFSGDDSEQAKSRRSKNTKYAEGQGAYTEDSTGNGAWWLRSPGGGSDDAACVDYYGCVFRYGKFVSFEYVAARPALHLNLSSVSSWSYAGKVPTLEWDGIDVDEYELDVQKELWTNDWCERKDNADGSVTLTRCAGDVSWQVGEFGFAVPRDVVGNRHKLTKIIIRFRDADLTGTEIDETVNTCSHVFHLGDETNVGWIQGEGTGIDPDLPDWHSCSLLFNGTGETVITADENEKNFSTIRILDGKIGGQITIESIRLVKEELPGAETSKPAETPEPTVPEVGTPTPTGTPNPAVPPSESPSQHSLNNPTIGDDGSTTWDCVYFGNYWQNDTNGDGIANQKDEKQPIKWRVLSVDGDDVFLLADENLDCQPYNDENIDVTWETCTLRSWLNDEFIRQAFTVEEQSAIQKTKVVNDDNPEYGTEGGEDTSDLVYLLSRDEVLNPAYGFSGDYSEQAKSRRSKNTKYAERQGAYTENKTGNGIWWLRSPGYYSSYAAFVYYDGHVYWKSYTVNDDWPAARPALHLNLSSTSNWSYAGTVIVGETPASFEPGEIGILEHGVSDPAIDEDGFMTWNCVYFGNYWQNDTNGDGNVDQSDEKQPIKWRVLSVDGDDAFLMADENLDCQPYNDEGTDVTWETCTLRSWLNDDFFKQAFTEEEQSAIQMTKVVNGNNPEFGTGGGEDTFDHVYLPSLDEVLNPVYGFSTNYSEYAKSRRAKNTEYAKGQGAYTNTSATYADNGNWWLRSPGADSHYASDVGYNGGADRYGRDVSDSSVAVRPVLHLKLSSATSGSYAGIVTSE